MKTKPNRKTKRTGYLFKISHKLCDLEQVTASLILNVLQCNLKWNFIALIGRKSKIFF